MRRFIVVGLIIAALCRTAHAEEGNFTSSISAQDLTAAGLAGLTPTQAARLNALVEAYKSGALAAARHATDDALAAKQAAEAQAALADAKAQAALAKAAKPEVAKPGQAEGIFSKIKKGLSKSDAPADVPAVESSIPGKFRGWAPHQIFTLANGQLWQVANNESYFTPMVENPRVQIVPALITGYWMRFPDLSTQVRVNFLEGK